MALSRLSGSSRYFRPKPASLEIGERLDDGGYGVVHLGRLDGKDVAVKRLYRHWDDTVLQNFRCECDLLEGVDHPHVVEFKGAFYDETTDEPILVMELMAENLRQYLERNRGQLSRQKQLEICSAIVRGLRFLHTRSPPIVHRDLTDKNILLDADGVVKIGDLGQAKLKTAEYFSTTFPGQVSFMPPEAAVVGNSHYNEKLDMFSLGVLMLEIATQKHPRRDLTGISTTPEVLRRRGDLSKLDKDHPLQPLILSCLNDNPKERPDIVAVHTELLAMVEGVEMQITQSTASRPTHKVCSLSSGSGVFQTGQLLEDPPTLHSARLTDLPIATIAATAIVIGRNVYVCGGLCPETKLACVVQAYNLDKEMWTQLPPAPQYDSEAAAIDNELVLIAGAEASSHMITNMISSWTRQVWQQNIPAMPTKRFRPGVVTYGTYLIVAGGRADDEQTILSSIDVLDTTTRQWQTPANLQLPRPMYEMRITVCATHIYMASATIAFDANTKRRSLSKSVWQLPVSTLEKVLENEDHSPLQWVETAPSTFYRSTLLQYTAHPLAIGGRFSSYKPSRSIAVYDPHSNNWSSVGLLLEPRVGCAVVSLSTCSFMVCGGCSDSRNPLSTSLNTVEVVHMSH